PGVSIGLAVCMGAPFERFGDQGYTASADAGASRIGHNTHAYFMHCRRPVHNPSPLDRRLSVAPMMDWTTRDYRYLARLISRHTLLYTEMVTAHAVLHGARDYLLGYDDTDHPVALQLGGSEPAQLAEAARIGADYGYDEINLNVGCPSDRVQSGRFGACLMAEPALVAECVAAMQASVCVPVTVKSRIGIDAQDEYAFLHTFI